MKILPGPGKATVSDPGCGQQQQDWLKLYQN